MVKTVSTLIYLRELEVLSLKKLKLFSLFLPIFALGRML